MATPTTKHPLPKGYDTGRFDPARDTPTHGRGHYVKTEDVKRVDLSGLDFPGRRQWLITVTRPDAGTRMFW